jgi:glycosyltransferase involved in cell wall biosynthesis
LACVVVSLQCAPGLVDAVRSLADQVPRPEIVVVNSGGGEPAPLLRAAGLDVPVLNRRDPLLPGAARNLGIAATHGRFLAFLAADCRAEPAWVAGRLRAHRTGIKAVASVMTNAFPYSLVASAAHLRLYMGRMPDTPASERLLYSVSYDRMLFEQYGLFREDLREGEDTDFNDRLRGDVDIAWIPEVRTAHANPTRLRDLLRDQYERGTRSRVYDRLGVAAMLHVTLVKETRRALAQARRVHDPDERRRLIAACAFVPLASLAFSAGLVVAGARRK